jgi:hypothetical protein
MTTDFVDDSEEYEAAEMVLVGLMAQAYDMTLLRHPNCSDPAHPGCECCADEFEEDEDAQDESWEDIEYD